MAKAAAKKTAAKPAAKAKADKAKEAEAPQDEALPDKLENPISDDDLAEAEHTFAIHGFTAENLIGQLADYLIEDARTERKPWSELNEREQEAIIVEQGRRARFLVADIVKVIANKGLNYMEATLEGGSFKMGDGALKLKTVVDFTPEHAEYLAQGSVKCVLVLATLKEFEGKASITATPDEPGLPLSAENEQPENPPHDPDTGEILDDDESGEGGGEGESDTLQMADIDEQTEANARKRAP